MHYQYVIKDENLKKEYLKLDSQCETRNQLVNDITIHSLAKVNNTKYFAQVKQDCVANRQLYVDIVLY